MLNQISLFLLTHKKEQANRWVSPKDTCLRRGDLFLLVHKKEQAIDEYYRQVGGSLLFLWDFRGNINFLPQKLAYLRKKEIFGVLRTLLD